MMDERIQRAAKILENEFGTDWMTVAQMLGTEDLRRRVGKELTSFMAFNTDLASFGVKIR